MPDVVIIKYNAGNVQSVMFALDRLGATYELSDDAATIRAAKRVIFPGVGEASTAMKSLHESQLATLIPTLTQPFLGTCVGMQLLCRHSAEGDTPCLGVFDVDVIKFPTIQGYKVPQTGWNDITNLQTSLCNGVQEGAYVYYNHGYYAPLSAYTVAQTNYILPYSAILQKDNFYACQFHSEISGGVGEQIFHNFLQL